MKFQGLHIFLVLFFVMPLATRAQVPYTVKGTVYDSSRAYRIQAVTVMSSSGKMTFTDSMGNYKINVSEKDSIWFSYLGKSTHRYAVLKMPDINQFDISLQLKSVVMEEIKVRSRSYKQDSLQNRIDYAKVFNYKKVSVESMTSIGPNGAGIDLAELIRLFQFRKNKSMLKFQERLLEQERDKFVDHRFSKALVRRLTELDGDRLELFMIKYRPTYEFTVSTSEYDFQLYIKNAAEQFQKSF